MLHTVQHATTWHSIKHTSLLQWKPNLVDITDKAILKKLVHIFQNMLHANTTCARMINHSEKCYQICYNAKNLYKIGKHNYMCDHPLPNNKKKYGYFTITKNL